ncbi:MAG TPA: hypothetical protein VGJ48_19210 [Pyrinomonadaceae bacterium]|jgi:hypothetical protein
MPKLDDDVDSLFRLPLAEFIGARKTLAARLKKDGRAADAERVKLLAKPSISAWAVNQLYWHYREAFDRLIATGQRFHKAQTSGKVLDMRAALEARRETLSELSELATTVLRNADHNLSPETLRRVTTTLEALSAYASISDSGSDRPTPGRLTADVDPPGFESFAPFKHSVLSTHTSALSAKPSVPSTPPSALSTQHSVLSTKKKMAAAKVSLQNAKRSLTAARATVQSLEGQQKKADAVANEAEKHRRETEKQSREVQERLKKATAASEDADQRTRSISVELQEATKGLDDAKRAVENATKELESL